jgi:CTP:molybdopterin cytidylyltransferase MocA
VFVTGLVLVAGASRRLGRPEQLLPYGGATELHCDKAVWKLLHSGRYPTSEVTVDGPVPIDVDTWDDYRALLARAGEGAAP